MYLARHNPEPRIATTEPPCPRSFSALPTFAAELGARRLNNVQYTCRYQRRRLCFLDMKATAPLLVPLSAAFFPAVPVFLCPVLAYPRLVSALPIHIRSLGPDRHARRLHIETTHEPVKPPQPDRSQSRTLPWSCPGCGALTQMINQQDAGFYTTTRKSVRAFLAQHHGGGGSRRCSESEAYTSALHNADEALLQELGLEDALDSGDGG